MWSIPFRSLVEIEPIEESEEDDDDEELDDDEEERCREWCFTSVER